MSAKSAGAKNPERLKHLYVHTTQGWAGILSRESQIVFGYQTDDPAREISLVLPVRRETYSSNILPGVLRQNLPEGYLLGWIQDHFGKTMKMDDFNLLALTGIDTIGRVSVNIDGMPSEPSKPEDLAALLAWKGSESLFDRLAEKYAASSGISGVQPKVLVPATVEDKSAVDRGHMKDRNLIIKTSGADYEDLAENEYHCMSIAAKAGIEVPRFWLSENKEIFVVERFDIDKSSGQYLGFEDMTALTGKQNKEKYDSSYENIAKAISLFCSPAHRPASFTAFFKSLVLSTVVRNGDAHLKNFGLLYTTPQTEDIRLSPLYDVICTTAYIPKDILALKLNKSKSWPSRESLIEFGKAHCNLDRPAELVDQVIEAAMDYRPAIEAGDIWPSIHAEMEFGARSIGGL